jgi:DNA-binding response OmpR family regulator
VVTLKRVLVVDDQYQIRRMVRWAVESAGFEMHEAANGEMGVAMALKLRPHLVLLDVMMPGRFDGLAVCRILRSRPEMEGTWVVLLSGNDSPQDREQGKQAGANAYLAKPFKPGALATLIQKLVASGPAPRSAPAQAAEGSDTPPPSSTSS